jgi:hypothetical protein
MTAASGTLRARKIRIVLLYGFDLRLCGQYGEV